MSSEKLEAISEFCSFILLSKYIGSSSLQRQEELKRYFKKQEIGLVNKNRILNHFSIIGATVATCIAERLDDFDIYDMEQRDNIISELCAKLEEPRIITSLLQKFPTSPRSAEHPPASANPHDIIASILRTTLRLLQTAVSQTPPFLISAIDNSVKRLSQTDISHALETTLAIERQSERTEHDLVSIQNETDYRLEITRTQDRMEVIGVDLQPETRSHLLSVAYVSLNLTNGSSVDSRTILAEDLLETLRPTQGRLLLRGDAGSGKSTFLRWTALTAARSERMIIIDNRDTERSGVYEQISLDNKIVEQDHWRKKIPFIIRLRDSGSLFPSADRLPDYLEGQWKAPRAWIRSVLASGRGLVLLDGVDEVPVAERKNIENSIREIVRKFSLNYFIITTRPQAVPQNWLDEIGFREAEMNPMSDLDRQKFIEKWHAAVARERTINGKPIKEIPEIQANLIAEISNSPHLSRLAVNPLLCSVVCALHFERKQHIPSSISQLCEDLCHMLLERRELESNIDIKRFPEPFSEMTYDQKRLTVQKIADYMINAGLSSIATETVENIIAEQLRYFVNSTKAKGAIERRDASVVCKMLVERSGMLREDSPGSVSFIHNTFKEFLVGELCARREILPLLAKLHDPNWQPVILFAAAARDTSEDNNSNFSTKLILALLNDAIQAHTDLRTRQMFAIRCNYFSISVSPTVRAKIQDVIKSLFPPQDFSDAEALSSGNNEVVDYLRCQTDLTENQMAACVRTLRLIGTPAAKSCLLSYSAIRSMRVIEELVASVDALRIDYVREFIQDGKTWPKNIASQISSIVGIASIKNSEKINSLDLSNTSISDYRPIRDLAGLRRLIAGEISDPVMRVICELKKLETLSFSAKNLHGLHNIGALSNLSYLKISNIENFDPKLLQQIGQLTKIKRLVIEYGKLSDLSFLKALNNLRHLYLRHLTVADFKGLGDARLIETLDLSGTNIKDINVLSGMRELKDLSLRRTPVCDISPLGQLQKLQILVLRETRVADVSSLKHINPLARLDISQTSVRDLTPVQGVKDLITSPPAPPAPPAPPVPPAPPLVPPNSGKHNFKSISAAKMQIAVEQPMFTWLHLSDIHFEHGDSHAKLDQQLVAKRLLEDLRTSMERRIPRPEVIFVTGDIAFSGGGKSRAGSLNTEYGAAHSWLSSLASVVGLTKQNIYMVPGNHDVNRQVDTDRDIKRLIESLRSPGHSHHPLEEALNHESDRNKLAARQGNYLKFAESFAPVCRELFWHTNLSKAGFEVRIVGLNTALLSSDDRDQGQLALGLQQIQLALDTGSSEVRHPMLNIVLSHHPFQHGWLRDQAEVSNWLSSAGGLHLSGHLHSPETARYQLGDGTEFVRVSAGAVHCDPNEPTSAIGHGYSIGSVFGEPNAGKVEVRIWPRKWSTRKKLFSIDTDGVPENRQYASHILRIRK